MDPSQGQIRVGEPPGKKAVKRPGGFIFQPYNLEEIVNVFTPSCTLDTPTLPLARPVPVWIPIRSLSFRSGRCSTLCTRIFSSRQSAIEAISPACMIPFGFGTPDTWRKTPERLVFSFTARGSSSEANGCRVLTTPHLAHSHTFHCYFCRPQARTKFWHIT